MKILTVISAAAVLACVSLLCLGQTGKDRSAAIALLERMITALNTRDEAKLRGFLEANATNDVPINDRVERLMGFAHQGSPFRIASAPIATGSEVKAELIDRENVRLNITLLITGGTTPKMKSLRAAPANASPRVEAVPNWKTLRDLAETLAKRSGSPAMSIALLRDGKSEAETVGQRKIDAPEAVGTDEPWHIGSIGKPICSTVIGKLIEQGKLHWNQTLGQVLKGIPMQPGYAAATIEQLMQHRAGIPQDMDFRRDRVLQIVGDAKTPTAMRANYARDILGRKPIGKPGERFAYSNAGYALLGSIAERVTGKSYEQLVRELIFQPLKLKNSYTGIDRLPANRPSGHINRAGELTPANMTGALEFLVAPAGGGLFMSTADLATFGNEHLKGLRGKNGLLKAATVARLHRGLPEGDGSLLYACGWGVESNFGVQTFHGHNGSNGTFRAQLAIFPKANLVVASMINCGGEQEPSPPLEAVLAIARCFAK